MIECKPGCYGGGTAGDSEWMWCTRCGARDRHSVLDPRWDSTRRWLRRHRLRVPRFMLASRPVWALSNIQLAARKGS
jgi:hypothetical protein